MLWGREGRDQPKAVCRCITLDTVWSRPGVGAGGLEGSMGKRDVCNTSNNEDVFKKC